jgi:hypothetical protein
MPTTAPPSADTAPSQDLTITPTGEGGSVGSPSSEGYWPAPVGEGYGSPVGEGYSGPVYSPSQKKPPFNAIACGGDDAGKPGSCSSVTVDKSCAPFPFVNSACSDAITYYKPRVAERAVSCIRSRSPMQLCDAMSVYDCKDVALRGACRDTTTVPDCQVIVASCPKTKMNECIGYLSGMNGLGRSEMVKCMKSDCTYGLYSCAEGL